MADVEATTTTTLTTDAPDAVPPEPRAAVVHRLYEEGWNPGTPDAVSALVADAYESVDGPFWATDGGLRRLEGAEAFAAHLARYTDEWAELHLTVTRTVVDGDTVYAEWRATGKSRTRTFTSRAGREVPERLDARGVSIVDVVDGQVTRHDVFGLR
jgi:hypothetical protein